MATTIAVDQALGRLRRTFLPAVEDSWNASEEPGRTPRDRVVDLAALTIALLTALIDLHGYADKAGLALVCLVGAVSLAACAALWERRDHPLSVGAFAIGASAMVSGARGAALIGLFTIAVHCPPRLTARFALASVLAAALSAALYGPGDHYDWRSFEAGLILSVAVVGYGLWIRVRRELVAELRERSRRLETEQELRLSEARHAERTRIAREMHDVLAHRISLLSVHAAALEYSPGAPGEELSEAAGVVRESARAAQEELRAVIGVLRDDGTNAGRLEPPQPNLGELEELIAESRRAGMNVTCDIRLDISDLPSPLGRTVYRLVQEALTNIRKHAPSQKATITVTGRRGAGLTVKALNHPLVGRAREERSLGGSGTGLVGLRERVELAGGELDFEALDDGGFALEATLPWT